MLIGIVIGMLAWQTIIAIVNVITCDDYKTACCGVGIWIPLTYIITLPIAYILKRYKETHYVAMMLDKDGRPCYCKSSKEPEALNEFDYKWNEAIREKYKIEDGWKEHQCCMGIVNIRYTPIKIALAEGAYKVDKETIKQAKYLYNNRFADDGK